MTAILNAKKSRQDRETLPISSPIEHSTRYFPNDDFKKRQKATNFPLLQDISASLFWKQQAPVVQTLDSAIHRINHYPADKYYGNQLRYSLDSDLSGGQRYPTFEQPWPGLELEWSSR